MKLDLVRKFGSRKPKKKPLRSPPRVLPTVKRRKSSAAKKSISPLALGNLYGRDDESEDSDEFEGVTHEYNMVKICDEDTITYYYHCQLVRISGNPLKKILKAWIKDIQPKKQGSHPYNGGRQRDDAVKEYGELNGGELTKPDWWPPTTGWPTHGCRHREPDHLLKAGQSSPLLRDLCVLIFTKSASFWRFTYCAHKRFASCGKAPGKSHRRWMRNAGKAF